MTESTAPTPDAPRQRPLPSRANRAVTAKSAALPQGSTVAIPEAMRRVRHRPQPTVELPGGEVPLIHPKDPDNRQLQDHWLSEIKVFDLSDPDQLDEYRQIWQAVSDGQAVVSDHQVNFAENKGTYLAYMRWSDIRTALPGQPRPGRVQRGPVEPTDQEG